jgi:hypothetical protein
MYMHVKRESQANEWLQAGYQEVGDLLQVSTGPTQQQSTPYGPGKRHQGKWGSIQNSPDSNTIDDDAEHGGSKHHPADESCEVENQFFPAFWHFKSLKTRAGEHHGGRNDNRSNRRASVDTHYKLTGVNLLPLYCGTNRGEKWD